MRRLIYVELEPNEVQMEMLNGYARYFDSKKKGYTEGNGLEHSEEAGIKLAVNGAIAEWAVAKVLNLMPNFNIGNLDKLDVGETIEVKSIFYSHHKLIIRPKEEKKINDPFVLVHFPHTIHPDRPPTKNLECILLGWCWGREGIKNEYWYDPKGNRAAWFVPKRILHHDWEVLQEYCITKSRSLLQDYLRDSSDHISEDTMAEFAFDW